MERRELQGINMSAVVYQHSSARDLPTSYEGGGRGLNCLTDPCSIAGLDGDGEATVLLYSCQSVATVGPTHCHHCTTIHPRTGRDSEGVCDEVGVHHFPRRLGPHQHDRGGPRGDTHKRGGGGGEDCRGEGNLVARYSLLAT